MMKSIVQVKPPRVVRALDVCREGGLFRTESGADILLPKGAETNGSGQVVAVRLLTLTAYTISFDSQLMEIEGSVTITNGGG